MSTPIDIGIPEQARQATSEGLARLLADSYTLYLQTHNYHWNVTGPMFATLHGLFEEQYTELATAVDEIAERIRSLGFYAPGTFEEFQALATVDGGGGVPSAQDMVARLVDSHEAVVRTAREVFPVASEASDESSADLVTQRMQVHEKSAWMLRSLLVDQGGRD